MISPHTLEVLEFSKIISLIKERCVTAYGPPEVDRFTPMVNRESIETKIAAPRERHFS